ncbi:proton-associated sugar transporter A-like [Lytechinus pictus]|uniref:proton-associated sugar transporter A-like n=1 Tax=Lytechinus pictus TaxID=7653 RepID=UPI0030BA1E6E
MDLHDEARMAQNNASTSSQHHHDHGRYYSASVPTSTGRLKSYPVRVPTNSPHDTTSTSPPGSPVAPSTSYMVSPRRSLSISVGDSGAHRFRNDSGTSQALYRTPPLVIRSRRSSFSTTNLTLHPPSSRHKGVAPPPKRTLWQLTRNSSIQFGLEVCYATETAMVTPILLQLGLPTKLYGIAFFLAPIFGFLMNPFIGTTSDRCMCSWGRRRPFILALGIGTLLGVSLYLNGGDIGALIGNKKSEDNLWGIVITLIGVIILDISADSSDGPSRAYLIDVCDLEDVNTGLNLRAVLGGIGGGLGYIANGIDWTSTSLAKALGGQLRVVFLFNVIIYSICLILNLTSIPETPLEKSSKDANADKMTVTNDENENDGDVAGDTSPLIAGRSSRSSYHSESRTGRFHRTSSEDDGSYSPLKDGSGRHGGLGVRPPDDHYHHPSALPQIGEDESMEDNDEEPASVLALLKSILHMPTELRCLCLNHYFGWAGMVTVLLFFTDFVGQAVYNGDPTAPEDSRAYNSYHEGVKMGCWGMAVFAFSSSLSAIFFMKVDHILSNRTLYVFGQLCFAVCAGLMAVLVRYEYAVLAFCFGFGVQFTTLMTIPFNILAEFHDCDSYKNPKGGVKRGLGTDVACLCCQLFLAQITVSAIMGPLVSAVGSHVTVVIFASIMGFIASLLSALLVIYKPLPPKVKENTSVQERC